MPRRAPFLRFAGTASRTGDWNEHLHPDLDTWNSSAALLCHPNYATWTVGEGDRENRPINCVNWFQMYAFCIWDGGFLPSEAEWNFAASGGDQQRYFPWSVPANSKTVNGTYASYDGLGDGSASNVYSINDFRIPGSYSPKGDGRWSHADLGGNVAEWNLDLFAALKPSCDNCAETTATPAPNACRLVRGAGFVHEDLQMRAGYRDCNTHTMRGQHLGGRCARIP